MAAPLPSTVPCIDDASAWMHRGIDLLNANTSASLEEAVRSFDRAIALRRVPPWADNPRLRYGLAAGWINRGDALALLGAGDQVLEAVKSYDEAITLLQSVPLDEDPLYPRRLAIAWINRGLARQKAVSPEALADAVRSFHEALAILEAPAAEPIEDLGVLRAGALINLAGALLKLPEDSAAEARDAAHRALRLVKETEPKVIAAGEIGLKARHLLCRTIAGAVSDEKALPPELIAEATDAVDEGLALARRWEERGEHGFFALSQDLFRFGCRVYSAVQPHFLAEFILENVEPARPGGISDPNSEMREAAVLALWKVWTQIQQRDLPAPSTPEFAHLLESLQALRIAEERLGNLRPQASASNDRTTNGSFGR